MEPPLAGTAALVTGASSGIGAATARRLARDGACVALVARRHDRLQALAASIENAGGTPLAVEADITDRAQAEAAVQQAAGRFGRLDILVNNAGLMLLGPITGADPQEWDRRRGTGRATGRQPARGAQSGRRRLSARRTRGGSAARRETQDPRRCTGSAADRKETARGVPWHVPNTRTRAKDGQSWLSRFT